MQIKRLAESIERFGFNSPIIVDEAKEILVGHARREAAILLNLKEVPVVIKDGLSSEDKRAYRIIDNKIADQAEVDLESLRFELTSLAELEYDLSTFGLHEILFDTFEGVSEAKPSARFTSDRDQPEFENDSEKSGDPLDWSAKWFIEAPGEVADEVDEALQNISRRFAARVNRKV